MAETRTLEILVKVKDLATKAIGGIQGAIKTFATSAQAALKQVAIGFLRRIGELLLQIPGQLIAAGKAFLQHADEVQKLSAALGTTAESFTAMTFAAGQSGVSQSELANDTKFLVKAMEEARTKAGENRHIFKALGIDVDTLGDSQLDLVEVYAQVADGINAISSPTERAATLMKLFGRSGHEVALLMKEGGAGIRALAKDAQELGIVLSTSTVKMADDLGDQLNRVKAVFRGLFNDVAGDVMPKITEALKVFVQFIKDNRTPIIETIKGFGSAFITVGDVIVRAVALFAGAIREFLEKVSIGLKALQVAFFEAEQFANNWIAAMGGAIERHSALVKSQIELSTLLKSDAKTSMLDYVQKWDELVERLKAAGVAMQDFGTKSAEAKEPVRATITEFDKLTEAVRGGAQTELGNFFENIVTGAKSVKAAFKDMVLDMLRLLARLVAQFAAAQIFSGIGLGPVTAGAGGASRPSASRIGAGVRLGGGGGGFGPQGGGPTNVNVTIQAVDAQSFVQLATRNRRVFEDIFVSAVSHRRDVRVAIAGV